MLGMDVRVVFEAGGARRRAPDPAPVVAGIRRGQGIVESMKLAGWRLPGVAWSLLAAGEETGRLGESMKKVGEMLHQRMLRRREVMGQLWYPALVCTAGTLVMLLILFWVVPEMRAICLSMGSGTRLPWLTQHIGMLYGLTLLGLALSTGLLATLIVSARLLASRYPRWALLEESIHGHLPVLAKLRSWRREARCLCQLSVLLQGGITLPAALETIALGAASRWEQDQLMQFRRRLLMGAGFKEGLRAFAVVDAENEPLLLAGQEAGCPEVYMERIAAELEALANWRIQQCIRFLEPAMLLILSVAIGGLILAYLLPMVRIFEQLA